jgi:hypothetical protein
MESARSASANGIEAGMREDAQAINCTAVLKSIRTAASGVPGFVKKYAR